MNYRHAFHAGNPADVLKHAVLAWILTYLNRKAAPYAVIDSHAGLGLYDLASEEALRTGEWVEGIGRLAAAELPLPLATVLEPLLALVRLVNGGGKLRHYPGSPVIAQELTRADDRLLLCEKHPDDAEMLRTLMRRDRRVKVLEQDGWLAPRAFLPPKERRGLLLVDPPFEEAGEFERCLAAIEDAKRRWASGIVMVWYPVKDSAATGHFEKACAAMGLGKWARITLMMRPLGGAGLPGSAVFVVNPPFGLAEGFADSARFWAHALRAPQARLSVEAHGA